MNYHEPVLLKESIDGLNIQPDGIYVDVTFGGGGHSREILKRLDKGRLVAFDQDVDALSNAIQDDRFTLVQGNFRFISQYLHYLHIEQVDGILADLGVSSHHFDEGERGFSFRFEGELDMRMNRHSTFSAKEVINEYTEKQLSSLFYEYGEINNAGKLAQLIVAARQKKALNTIPELVSVIETCIPKAIESKYLAKVFQALRIEVNKEMMSLKALLEQAPAIMKPKARLSVIAYHSLEDRLVKNFIRSGNFEGTVEKDFYGNTHTILKAVHNKVIVPTENEMTLNPRARSAKLRIAEKAVI